MTNSRRLMVVSTLLIASLLALSSAANAKTVSPDTYAAKVCSALWGLRDDIRTFADGPHSSIPRGAKAELITFLSKAVGDTNATVRSFQKAGIPKVPNGTKIADGLVQAMKQVKRLFAQAEAMARRMSTSSVSALKSDAKELQAVLEEGSVTLSGSVRGLKKLDPSGRFSRGPCG